MKLSDMIEMQKRGYTDDDFKRLLEISETYDGDTEPLLALAAAGAKPDTISRLLSLGGERTTTEVEATPPVEVEVTPTIEAEKVEELQRQLEESQKKIEALQRQNRITEQGSHVKDVDSELIKIVENMF